MNSAPGWPSQYPTDSTGIYDTTRKVIAYSGKSLLIDGNFSINQRGYVSGTTLAAGAFGHDCWQDFGSGTLAYTFSTGTPDTLVTVTAGNMKQVVPASLNGGGDHVVSWSGTCQVSVAYTSAGSGATVTSTTSPLGYPCRPGRHHTITVYTQTTGTFGLVQLERGLDRDPLRTPIERVGARAADLQASRAWRLHHAADDDRRRLFQRFAGGLEAVGLGREGQQRRARLADHGARVLWSRDGQHDGVEPDPSSQIIQARPAPAGRAFLLRLPSSCAPRFVCQKVEKECEIGPRRQMFQKPWMPHRYDDFAARGLSEQTLKTLHLVVQTGYGALSFRVLRLVQGDTG